MCPKWILLKSTKICLPHRKIQHTAHRAEHVDVRCLLFSWPLFVYIHSIAIFLLIIYIIEKMYAFLLLPVSIIDNGCQCATLWLLRLSVSLPPFLNGYYSYIVYIHSSKLKCLWTGYIHVCVSNKFDYYYYTRLFWLPFLCLIIWSSQRLILYYLYVNKYYEYIIYINHIIPTL